MKLVQQLSIKHGLKITPQLQQALQLLQLSSPELELEIKNALESNPLLELVEPYSEPTPDLPVETIWDSVTTELPYSLSLNNSEQEVEEPTSFTSAEATLQDHLFWQLNLTPFSEHDLIIAINIIDSISDDGYLVTSLEEIHASLVQHYPDEFAELDLAEIIAVLHKIQQFDPVGVGSRNLQECLLLQLRALPATTPHLSTCKYLVANHIELLGKKDYAQLKKLLSKTEQDFTAIMHTITQLNPHPGNIISSQKEDYIVPDVLVKKEHDRWVLELNPEINTNVRINPSYAALIKRSDNSRDNLFLREQLLAARWFLNGLKNRHVTLLKVATCIVTQQREFLEHGEEHMQPLILQDVAKVVGLNESTVSRVTNKKYIHTPRGTFELKFFFSSHIANSDGNNCSSTAIKAIIKQLISKESAVRKLTDQEITQILLQRGIKLARRTVAKYREALGIKPSSQR